MAESSIAQRETRDLFHPTRVLISAEGEAVAPGRTTVHSDVIFVRNDGWSLGAPKHLEAIARKQWQDRWTERWQLRDDGHWEKTWPLIPDDAVRHTAGPWRVDPTDRHEVLTADDRFRVLLTTVAAGAVREEWAANARLIAAAPDLLAALKRLKNIAVWDEDFDADDRAEFDAAIADADAAVAQAEGRQS